MDNARKFVGWLLALACAANVGAAQPELRIQFAEKVQLPARPGHVEFDAYGRRFAFDLESNDRLLAAIPAARKAQLGSPQLMRGKLAGAPGSWVRIARVGDGLEGAIWDGNELYVVTSAAAIADALTTPLAAAPSDSVVFRLSDAINGLPKNYCGVAPGAAMSTRTDVTALAQYKSLVGELRSASAAAELDQLDVALIADVAFQNSSGANPAEVVVARLNTVDGIFTEQVGVLLVPSEVRLVPQGSDPFTQTAASDLLRQLSDYRMANPAVRAAGLAHLLTGKDLDSNVLGIAYLDTLCDQQRGVSLSSDAQSSFYTAMVMAHEFGHNFGAGHDGEAGSTCAATSPNYLMAPAINGSSTFSQCSLNRMATSVARARGSCIVSASYADLALEAPTTMVLGDAGGPFSIPLTVRSVGPLAAIGARLNVSLPPGLGFVSGAVPGGDCSAVGSEVTCSMGDIASGDQRVIDLRVLSGSVRSFSVPVSVSATNDFITANNSAIVQAYTRSGIDLGVTIAATPNEVYINELIDFTVDVSAVRTQAARGGILNIYLGGISIESIGAAGNSCSPLTPGSPSVQCQLLALDPGAQTRVIVHGRATSAGALTASARVSVSQDSNTANDNASVGYSIFNERDVMLAGSIANLRAVIGEPFDVTYTLTTIGRQPSDAVWLQVIGPTGADVESVVPSLGACSQQNIGVYRCDFGTLSPGDVRTVVARYRMTANGTSTAIGVLRLQDGTQERSRRFDTQIFSALRVDAAAVMAEVPYPAAEGEWGNSVFRLETLGVEPAQNVMATLVLPPNVRFTTFFAQQNADPWQCSLDTAQRAICTGSFASATSLWVQYQYESDIPGEYQARLTISATGDGNATNDAVDIPIRIDPFYDVAVTGATERRNFIVGDVEDFNFTVTTGRRPVPGVGIRASSFPTYYNWETMTINGIVCQRTDAYDQVCAIGDLPANANVPVTLRYRFVQAGMSSSLGVSATTGTDYDLSNNSASFNFSIMALTDVQVSVAGATATAVSGGKLRLPEIAVRAGAGAANDVVLTVTLPPFTTVEYVAGNALCSGTTTIQCFMTFIAPGDARYFDISLNTTAPGTFTSNISIQAANDSNAGNNTSDLALSVTDPPAPPPPPPPPPPSSGGGSSSSSGGGGGGRIEWFALAFLAVFAWRGGSSRRKVGGARV